MKFNKLHEFFQKDNFNFNVLIFFIIMNSGNFFSYLFQFFLARFTTVENFGDYNSLNSITLYFSAIIASLPYFVTKVLSDKKNENLLWFFLFFSLLLINFLIVIFHFFFADKFDFDNINYFYYMYAIINLSTIISFFTGFLQFSKKYNKFSLVLSLQMLFRLIFLLSFIYLYKYLSISDAMIANLFPLLIILFIAFYFSFSDISKIKTSFTNINFKIIPVFFKSFYLIYFNNLIIIFLLSSDILLIKLKFDSLSLGLYSSAAIFAKILFYLPASLSIISYSENVKELSISKTKSIFFIINSISILILILFFLIGDFLIMFSFGSNYADASKYLMNLSFNLVLFANIVTFNYIFLSRNQYYQLIYTSFIFIFAYVFSFIYLDSIMSIIRFFSFLFVINIFCNLLQFKYFK